MLKTLSNFFTTGNGEKSEENRSINWQDISSDEELDRLLKASIKKTQVIYKHSTRCATSYMAFKSLESVSSQNKDKADFFMIDVITERPMSKIIADKLGIRHESPQLFIIKNEDVVWHGSHQQVQADVLTSFL